MEFNSLNYSGLNTKQYNPNFTACSRDVYDALGRLYHRNDTSMFRVDLGDWDKFVDYIGNKFKNTDKVNIYTLASSAGDEVYSLAIKLLEKYGEKGASKYFPIIASDYDSRIINMAQKGYLPMYEGEAALINKHSGGKFNEYFEVTEKIPDFIGKMDIDYDFMTRVKPKLKEKIQFHTADATEHCRKVQPDNTIILARNFWSYLKDESVRIKFANDLYKSLGKNSAIVLGQFDDTAGAFASKNLYDAGFVCHPEIYTIFEKNKITDWTGRF